MRKRVIQTLSPRNYDALRESIENNPILESQPDILADLQAIIAEHAALTKAAHNEMKRQELRAEGVFNFLETMNPLFLGAAMDPVLPESEASPAGDQIPQAVTTEGQLSDKVTIEKSSLQPRLKPVKSIEHKLSTEQRTCPCCGKNMHLAHKKKQVIIRFNGFSAEEHVSETARCLSCATKVEAKGPDEVTFGEFSTPAAAAMVALRYAYGMPSFRLQEVSSSLGYKIPDSTQWNIFEAVANELFGFHKFLRAEAADAPRAQMDDTRVMINAVAAKLRNAPSETATSRTGIHTTGYLASHSDGKICVFESGLHHAGEFFAKIMSSRTVDDSVILMMDAASANTSKFKNIDVAVTEANCNSHAVRKFKESAENPVFEERAEPILKLYSKIFKRDRILGDALPADRLAAHRKDSLPQMEEIKRLIESDFKLKRVEPNSELGKNYNYFLNHYHKLIAFCEHESAPICNNAAERLLKRAIRHRKNSLFFKNQVGAAVGDILMSILMTAVENKIEPVTYLNDLLDFPDHRKKNPKLWLPWNYPKTIAELRLPKASQSSNQLQPDASH
jgi:transposase